MASVTVKAPCSTANLGPGYDVFGLALNAFYDRVTLSKGGTGIKIQSKDSIPSSVEKNTAGIVVKEMVKKFKIKSGITIQIKKGVPPGYGLGSSAASAAAAAVGMNSFFFTRENPGMRCCLAGSTISSLMDRPIKAASFFKIPTTIDAALEIFFTEASM